MEEVAEEEGASFCSKEMGVEACFAAVGSLEIESGVKAGRLVAARCVLKRFSSSCALQKVLRTVGDVADSVSNLKVVAFLPIKEGNAAVFNESFGRFEGEGALESVGG